MPVGKQAGKVDVVHLLRFMHLSVQPASFQLDTASVNCSKWWESKAINSLNPEHTRMPDLYLEHKGCVWEGGGKKLLKSEYMVLYGFSSS